MLFRSREFVNLDELPDLPYNLIDVEKYVKETGEDIKYKCEKGCKEVSGAVSFNKSESKYKKRLPSHILGMKLWNALEYKYFIPGTKGYSFPINGIDTTKAPARIIKNLKHLEFHQKDQEKTSI